MLHPIGGHRDTAALDFASSLQLELIYLKKFLVSPESALRTLLANFVKNLNESKQIQLPL